jgi:tetratricopeptide (TPR) repeat protein
MGKNHESKQYYDKALNIDVNSVHALIHKGVALLNMKEYEESIMLFDRALIITPNDALIWNHKGRAIVYWIEHLAKTANITNWISIGNRGSEMKDEALKCYDTALDIDPNLSYYFASNDLFTRIYGRIV